VIYGYAMKIGRKEIRAAKFSLVFSDSLLGVSLAAEHFAWTARAIFFSLLFFSALSPSIDSYLAFF